MTAKYGVGPSIFARAAPFHLVVAEDHTVLQVGRSLTRLCPWLAAEAKLDEHVGFTRPQDATAASLPALVGRICEIEIRRTELRLRGQWLADGPRMVFLGRPAVTSFEDLNRYGIRLSHFAIHDPVSDYLFLLQARDHSLADIRNLQQRLERRNQELEDAQTDRRRLQAAAAEALRQSTQKTSFLTSMSHELRTPLNAIIGYAELLADEGDSPDVLRILESARHLKDLVDDVLALADVESGKNEVSAQEVLLAPLLDAALAAHLPAATRKGVALSATAQVEALWTDPAKLAQILSHLLSNAVRATHAGSVALRVEARDGQVVFDVSDTGCGISAEVQCRLFRPFLQGPDSERVGGTGLGLTIAKLLARLLGGDLTVQSEVGVGSTFRLALPAGPP